MDGQGAGRPQQARVTKALLAATLDELASNGYEKTTIAAIAARAKTSKQAVYRRYKDKAALIAAAIESALAEVNPSAPQRASVAEDLRQNLSNTVSALQETPLGGAIKALVPHRDEPGLQAVLDEAEASRRLLLRQIFIATPFEADMETRIDLLLGLIYFRLLIRTVPVGPDDIEKAIYMVLGLVPPKDPPIQSLVPRQALPGL